MDLTRALRRSLRDLDREPTHAAAVRDALHRARSLDDLAERTGLDADTLTRTLRYLRRRGEARLRHDGLWQATGPRRYPGLAKGVAA